MRHALVHRTGTIIAATATLLAAPLATAQKTDDEAGQDVTVIGSRPQEASKRAAAFVRAAGIVRGQEPAARWVDPVCPRVGGASAEQAALIETRIRSFAKEVGAPVAAGACEPNAVVIFTTDGAGVAQRAMQRTPRQFKDVPIERRDAILRGAAPIRWWHATQTRTADNMPPAAGQPSFVSIDGGTGGHGLPMGEGGVQLGYKSSTVSSLAIRTLFTATVVIDTGRIGDVTMDTLADFTALVSLAAFQPGDPPPDDSLLGLFVSPNAPHAATPSDLALLRQLYRFPLDRDAKAHRRMLARALVTATSKQ